MGTTRYDVGTTIAKKTGTRFYTRPCFVELTSRDLVTDYGIVRQVQVIGAGPVQIDGREY